METGETKTKADIPNLQLSLLKEGKNTFLNRTIFRERQAGTSGKNRDVGKPKTRTKKLEETGRYRQNNRITHLEKTPSRKTFRETKGMNIGHPDYRGQQDTTKLFASKTRRKSKKTRTRRRQ